MTQDSPPNIGSILHPSDFTDASDVAFAHALKAALVAHSQLVVMHVSPKMTAEWTDFPGVREVLTRWGLLPEGAPRSAVPALGIDIRKVLARDDNPVKSVLTFLDQHPADLIVLATHQHEGRSHWMHHSVSEPIARNSGQMTLFIPPGVDGFVSRKDGTVSLRSVLIPIAPVPRPQPALDIAARLVRNLESSDGTFNTLWVGDPGAAPAVRPPETPGWKWNAIVRSGDVIDGILHAARDTSADLLVMATDGRSGFLDALRGSHSERVLRQTPCPLLAIPVGADATSNLE